jgi:hypothetical protein
MSMCKQTCKLTQTTSIKLGNSHRLLQEKTRQLHGPRQAAYPEYDSTLRPRTSKDMHWRIHVFHKSLDEWHLAESAASQRKQVYLVAAKATLNLDTHDDIDSSEQSASFIINNSEFTHRPSAVNATPGPLPALDPCPGKQQFIFGGSLDATTLDMHPPYIFAPSSDHLLDPTQKALSQNHLADIIIPHTGPPLPDIPHLRPTVNDWVNLRDPKQSRKHSPGSIFRKF